MLENTLARALTKYRIHIHVENKFTDHEIDVICSQLDACENYLRQGNKATGTWMADNHNILAKVIKHAHDDLHAEDTQDNRNTALHEEHQELNKCMTFYKCFYEANEKLSK